MHPLHLLSGCMERLLSPVVVLVPQSKTKTIHQETNRRNRVEAEQPDNICFIKYDPRHWCVMSVLERERLYLLTHLVQEVRIRKVPLSLEQVDVPVILKLLCSGEIQQLHNVALKYY